MPAAMQISINVQGLNQAAANFGNLSRGMQATARQIKAIQSAAGGRGGGITGPLSRHQAAQAGLAVNPGSFDARHRAFSAQRALTNAEDRMAGRGGGGGGGMMALAGLGKIGVAAFIASEALGGFTRHLMDTGQYLSQLANDAQTSGGSMGEIAKLNFGFGVPEGSIAARANDFRSRLESDPFAMMSGARAGISPQMDARFGGNQNNATLLQQWLEHLRGITSQEQRLIEARRTGTEWALKLVNVSDRVWREMQQDAAMMANLGSEWQTLGNDFDAELGRFTRNMKMAFLPALVLMNEHFRTMTYLFQGLGQFFGPIKLNPGGAGPMAQNPIIPALNANTAATKRNTDVQLGRGTYGGGAGAQTDAKFLENQIFIEQQIRGSFRGGMSGPGVF